MDLGKRNEILRQIDDRLMEIMPFVLLWQSAKNKLLYWNRFGTPAFVLDKFNREDSALVYWWYDPAKAEALAQAQNTNTALPPVPPAIVYPEE
jgi:microcin C transport system substrate-binding protein